MKEEEFDPYEYKRLLESEIYKRSEMAVTHKFEGYSNLLIDTNDPLIASYIGLCLTIAYFTKVHKSGKKRTTKP